MEKQKVTVSEAIAEIRLCQESAVYFYNKYVRKEGEKELSAEEFELHKDAIIKGRNKRTEIHCSYPLSIMASFKDLPYFIVERKTRTNKK